ncbi:MAG TPA: PIN domain-containing protein [Armatimonadota bacterium]|nr:PIN domain-containing protein [Armatimonadota bacterium]
MDRWVLIDTSAWVEALAPDGDARNRDLVRELVVSRRAATCEVVVAEVLRGALDDADATAMTAEMGLMRDLPCDGMGARAAAMGRRLDAPRNRFADLLIAAVAQVHGVRILTRDRHLKRIAATFGIDEAPV